MSKKKTSQVWTWRDYALQLSVVIIGVMVTFAGSECISGWSERRQVKTAMRLVCEELQTNRVMLDHCCQKLLYDRNGMLMFARYGMDVDQIPVDSLGYYIQFPVLRQATFQSSGLNTLVYSGLISSVGDMDLLMRIFGCYRSLESFAETVEGYNARKLNAIDHFSCEGGAGEFTASDPRESWRLLLADPVCRSFISASVNYVGDANYLKSDIAGVGKTIAVIKQKYRFQ